MYNNKEGEGPPTLIILAKTNPRTSITLARKTDMYHASIFNFDGAASEKRSPVDTSNLSA